MNSTVAFAIGWLIGLPVVSCAATNVVVGCPMLVVGRWLGVCVCLKFISNSHLHSHLFPPTPPRQVQYFWYTTIFSSFAPPPWHGGGLGLHPPLPFLLFSLLAVVRSCERTMVQFHHRTPLPSEGRPPFPPPGNRSTLSRKKDRHLQLHTAQDVIAPPASSLSRLAVASIRIAAHSFHPRHPFGSSPFYIPRNPPVVGLPLFVRKSGKRDP
jgi:hypothetical protein